MSFLPVFHHFKVWKGSTWRYRFLWDLKIGNTVEPQPLEGCHARMEIIPVGWETPWATLTDTLSESGSGIVLNGETGLIDLIISHIDTSSIGWKQAEYEMSIINPLGEDIPLLAGKLSAVNNKSLALTPETEVEGSHVVAELKEEKERAQAAEATKLSKASNLSDLVSAPTARINLGLGSAALKQISEFDPIGAAAIVQDEVEEARQSSTNLYIEGANKTTVGDEDFPTTPTNGMLCVHYDTTAKKTYLSVRAEGIWNVMAGPV